MSSRRGGEAAGVLFWLLLIACDIYGTWHLVDRHERSWVMAMLLPPVSIYYAAESLWHSDGRREFCDRVRRCGETIPSLPQGAAGHEQCLHRLDVALAAETRARQRGFERFSRSVEKMTCQELADAFGRTRP